MKKNMNRIINMMFVNAAMGAAMTVEEAKLLNHYMRASEKN